MSENGKGDSPRSCFSEEFGENYDKIDWRPAKTGPFAVWENAIRGSIDVEQAKKEFAAWERSIDWVCVPKDDIQGFKRYESEDLQVHDQSGEG